jgi:hypothetical protein
LSDCIDIYLKRRIISAISGVLNQKVSDVRSEKKEEEEGRRRRMGNPYRLEIRTNVNL